MKQTDMCQLYSLYSELTAFKVLCTCCTQRTRKSQLFFLVSKSSSAGFKITISGYLLNSNSAIRY
jgi:hypothetical protein